MHRQTLILGLGALLLIGAGALVVNLTRSRPEPTTVERTPEPAPRPAAPARPEPLAPPAAPAPAARERPAPAPEPAPALVESAPTLGTVHIDSDVPGAQVFIDRAYIGTTPVTAERVKPGTHQVNVSAEGFEGLARTVEVRAGAQDLRFRLRDVRLDLSLAVVHKHRFGSCQGRLVATPKGLRYDTTHADDVFSVGLLDLERFEVDYLEKNLQVKPRKGRRSNFTDPAGNADHLFVFHRDVEKARERLQRGDPPAGE